MGMSEDDKRNCCLVEIQETEAKYYKTLEEIEKVSNAVCTHMQRNIRVSLVASLMVCQGTGPGFSRKMSAIGTFIEDAQMS